MEQIGLQKVTITTLTADCYCIKLRFSGSESIHNQKVVFSSASRVWFWWTTASQFRSHRTEFTPDRHPGKGITKLHELQTNVNLLLRLPGGAEHP